MRKLGKASRLGQVMTYKFDKASADIIIGAINRIPVASVERHNTYYANHAEDEEPTPGDIQFRVHDITAFGVTYFVAGGYSMCLDMFGFWNRFRIKRAVELSRRKFEAEERVEKQKKNLQHQFVALDAVMRELQK